WSANVFASASSPRKVDVQYRVLVKPIRPKDHIERIRPSLPAKYLISASSSCALFLKLGESSLERRTGNPHEPLKRPVQFQDQKDRARNGQSTDDQHRDDRGITGRQETQAGEQYRQPENQHHQERQGDRTLLLGEQPKTRFFQIVQDVQRTG